uniref:BTB domain-containing protein n=1 Tax=Araucaria cunninghamii TaxID=56994 RepID=A0A0D6QUB3_ARACU
MPPFQGQTPLQAPPSFVQKAIIAINVGGTVFHTSASALRRADPGSILANLTHSFPAARKHEESPFFFDRDPDLFAALLSILRTSKLPSNNRQFFSVDDLILEAQHYGATAAVKSALASPSLDGLDLVRKSVVASGGRQAPSALSTDGDGSLVFSHGSKISVYDWALRKRSVVLTHFNCIDALTRISPSIAVAGAVDFPGLHVYDLRRKTHRETVRWEAESREIRLHDPTVQAAAFSPSNNAIFASFESGRKNAHTIMLIDGGTFRPVMELGRRIGVDADFPARKLEWVDTHNILMSSSVNSGPFGYRGEVKLWDVKSHKIVWEWQGSNPGPQHAKNDPLAPDCFADVTVGEEFGAIFKVGARNGGLFMADLRQLDAGWVALGDSNPGPGGAQNKVLTYGKQVFVSRDGSLEAWCEVGSREQGKILRKNFVGSEQGGERITGMVAGGNRVFVARKGLQGVEVWESPSSSSSGSKLV